jgi:hypothetical protein
MLMSPMGLRSEKVCTGDARQKLKCTDPASRQRGHPTSTNPKLSKSTLRETIGHNITWTWTLNFDSIPTIMLLFVGSGALTLVVML